jgi:metallo-beta-lactamase family protein
VRLTFYGAAETVTGSCALLSADDGARLLVDCGMFQGSAAIRDRNDDPFPFDPGSIDGLVLTHAHIDHSGLLPRLVREGFKGRIYATRATSDLCRILLMDTAHIQAADAKWQNRRRLRAGRPPVLPLYTTEDVERCFPFFDGVDYGERVEAGRGVDLTFRDAGHILGSSFVEVRAGSGKSRRTVVFSGDLGMRNRPLLNDPELPADADLVVIESTYGDRRHKDRESSLDELAAAIRETVQRGGNVLIPAFAVGRTQEVLFEIQHLTRDGRIPRLHLYLDSPLAVSATEIYLRHRASLDEETRALLQRRDAPGPRPTLHLVESVEESRALNRVESGAIIVAASGMCEGGRIVHHLKHNLWRPECSIVFVGFQGRGTLGREIVDGSETVSVLGEEIAVRARVHTIGSFSAHADQAELLWWIGHFTNPALRVFVNHGEPDAARALAGQIRKAHPWRVRVPRSQETVEV